MRARGRTGLMGAALLTQLVVAPLAAAQPNRPITDRNPDAMDVAKTPITDLNLSRTEIPALLVEAEKRPYSLLNVQTCQQLASAVEELNGILGPDLDLPQAERARFDKGRIAQLVVGRLIPFRSLIREISGANRQERELRDAIEAGLARRGFLKGVGAARNCPYPASPATESILLQHQQALTAAGQTSGDDQAEAADAGTQGATPPASAPVSPAARPKPVFTSQPVVQQTPSSRR